MEKELNHYLEEFLNRIRNDTNFYSLGYRDGIMISKKIVNNLYKNNISIAKISELCNLNVSDICNLLGN